MPPYKFDANADIWPAIKQMAIAQDEIASRFTRKGDKRLLCDIDAQQASRRRTIKAKQEAATERTLAEARDRNRLRGRAAPGRDIASRMLRSMEPGKWYAVVDLMRLADADRNERGKVSQVMMKRGWVEKARNPSWDVAQAASVNSEPRYLYRMTPAGETHQRGLQAV